MEQLDAILPYKGILVPAALVGFLLLERLFPVARVVHGLRQIGRNLSLAALNAVLSWLVVVPVSALASHWAPDWRPAWWSGWPGLGLDLLILDCWIYWWHRANHRLPFLWRFHEVHHLDETLDATSALRFHFGEVVMSSLVRAALIWVMDMPITSVVVFETLLALLTMFHHSNLRLPVKLEGALSQVIVTPSIHWVHHHAIRADTDSNYAAGLSVWDRLFGSRSSTRRSADMPIGVEGRRDRSLGGLLVRPLDP
jgi:sterol desaturase/sphingolipid hydroxylase (fatty acid hydroxylase superfamily)